MSNSRVRVYVLVCLAIAVGLFFGYLIFEITLRDDGDPASASVAEFSTYPITHSEASIYSLALPELTKKSDLVSIATVVRASDMYRVPAGDSLTSIVVDYEVQVERYLKGSSGDSLKFRKTLATEDSYREVTAQFDFKEGLETGGRYFLFLQITEDALVVPTAEPFRFRIQDGSVHAESTFGSESASSGNNEALDEFFPPKTDAAFTSEVLALTAE